MKYNGMEVHEADGRYYQLSSTPKKMLVWTDDIGPQEHDVLGFYNGLWLMPSKLGGVCNWAHAAEIPKKPTLADYLKNLHHITGRFPFVVHPNGMPITAEESRDAVGVSEPKSLLYLDNLAEPSNTFVVLPGCSKMVKEMFMTLKDDNRNYAPHADVVFFGEDEE